LFASKRRAGLFQKTGDVIRAMYLFIQRAALKRRYDFPGIAQRVYDAVCEREFDRAYQQLPTHLQCHL
jgi:hypothetical protein